MMVYGHGDDEDEPLMLSERAMALTVLGVLGLLLVAGVVGVALIVWLGGAQ